MKTKFMPGQLRCRRCYQTKIADPGYCLAYGRPECCGKKMAVDNETERLNHPNKIRPQFTGNPKKTITEWESPGIKMHNTTHGTLLNYFQWCVCEAKRITAAGTPCEVVWKKDECAVAEVPA